VDAQNEQVSEALGDRLADRIAAYGGSWTFIIVSIVVLIVWTLMNALFLAPRHRAFDPYPFVFLNLLLSMLAALQAPVIMMSQNRQSERDRRAAAQDFDVNARAESEIEALQNKLDRLRETEWTELVKLQQEQIRLLNRIIDGAALPGTVSAARDG
jgi:uncharacterized membrane protein